MQSFSIANSYTQFLGVTRASLQLAWDFTTASEGCLTDRLLYVRDDAFKRIGDNGKYRVVRVENNYSKDIYRYDTVIITSWIILNARKITKSVLKIVRIIKILQNHAKLSIHVSGNLICLLNTLVAYNLAIRGILLNF